MPTSLGTAGPEAPGKPHLNPAAPSVHVALAVQHANLDASQAAAARSAALQALDAASQQAPPSSRHPEQLSATGHGERKARDTIPL